MSDKDIENWDQRLKNQVLRGWENYVRKRINLSTARATEFWGIAGEFFYVEDVSSESASASIRLNRNTNDSIALEIGVVIKTIFKEFYITNAAQANEWIDVIVGINFEYYKKQVGNGIVGSEAQPAIIVTNALPNTNTIAASHICNRALIRAHSANTGTAWVNFGAAASANNCFELEKRDAVSVPLSNTNRINVLFTVANERVTVVFEA